MKKGIGLIILGLVVMITPNAIVMGYQATGPDYEFQNHVHSYMLNAYYSNTPDLMIDQLHIQEQLDAEDQMHQKEIVYYNHPHAEEDD